MASPQKRSPRSKPHPLPRHAALVQTGPNRKDWIRPQAAIPVGHRGSQAPSYCSGSLCQEPCSGPRARKAAAGPALMSKWGYAGALNRTLKCTDPRLWIDRWAIILFLPESFDD